MIRKKILKIESVEYLSGYKLKIDFSDGKKQVVDFGPFLENSGHTEVRKFLDLKKFKKYELNDGELMWGDFDLIFPLNDLYENNIQHDSIPNKKLKVSSGGR